jgi:hypothetical protein
MHRDQGSGFRGKNKSKDPFGFSWPLAPDPWPQKKRVAFFFYNRGLQQGLKMQMKVDTDQVNRKQLYLTNFQKLDKILIETEGKKNERAWTIIFDEEYSECRNSRNAVGINSNN